MMQSLFKTNCKIVLASASPRRQQFLQELGLDYLVILAKAAEPLPNINENATDYALRAAKEKAKDVFAQIDHDIKSGNQVIIASDTVVSVDGKILGKPIDCDDALRMLKLLSGRAHTVISAVSIIFSNSQELSFFDETQVFFHPWADEILKNYAHCGEPMDKAGAYAIQGQGAFLVEKIQGSWSNVVGLPITKLVNCLLQYGVIKE